MLTPGKDGLVRMSLVGNLHEETVRARATLLGLTSLWARPEPLRVALSADAAGSWQWAEAWTDALEDMVVEGYEVRFVSRGGTRGRR